MKYRVITPDLVYSDISLERIMEVLGALPKGDTVIVKAIADEDAHNEHQLPETD